MNSPVFNAFGNQNNNMNQMVQQFQQFKNTLKGNPKDMVQQMMNNGKITQADLNRAQAFANQFRNILK